MPLEALLPSAAANGVNDWIRAATFASGGWLLGQVLYRLAGAALKPLTQRSGKGMEELLIERLRAPVVVLITVLGIAAGFNQLTLGARATLWAERVLLVAVTLSVTWIVARVVNAVIGHALRSGASDAPRSAHFLPGLRTAVHVLVWGLGIVLALNNAGYDVAALLAGIGIGGLAMALAAQETVANVFGGITIYADKPFKPGDRVRVDGHDGFVQQIGIRSTRIQSLAGPLVVIPNKKFTESTVENVSDEPSRRVLLELGLVYETPPDRMQRAIDVLHEIVMANQDILEENHIVSFNTFKEYSLNLLFICFIRKGSDIFEGHSRVNLAILHRFNEERLAFAYPTAVELQGTFKP